jgi:hypothetical protein
MQYKTLLVLGSLLISAECVKSAGLPFLWHGRSMAVEFEKTNLTDSVRQAIKDDIAYALSLISASNVTYTVYPQSHPGYGKCHEQ